MTRRSSRRDRYAGRRSPVETRLPSGALRIQQLPPVLADGSCRGCGYRVDPVTGDCGCTR